MRKGIYLNDLFEQLGLILPTDAGPRVGDDDDQLAFLHRRSALALPLALALALFLLRPLPPLVVSPTMTGADRIVIGNDDARGAGGARGVGAPPAQSVEPVAVATTQPQAAHTAHLTAHPTT
jgi:hypothetical protein